MTNIKLIVAIDNQGVMGYENSLPWKLSDDLKHFKTETLGCPIIMGSNTFISLSGILPNREHIVLSKTLKETNKNVYIFSDINLAIDYIKGYETAYLIGGPNVIHQFLKYNLIDELIITQIDAHVVGDTYLDMKKLDIDNWVLYNSKKYTKNDKNEYDFIISKYIKKKKRFY